MDKKKWVHIEPERLPETAMYGDRCPYCTGHLYLDSSGQLRCDLHAIHRRKTTIPERMRIRRKLALAYTS